MSPIADLVGAWRGLVLIMSGDADAGKAFNASWPGLAIALGWLVLADLLGAAVQSMGTGLPRLDQLVAGLLIQAITVAALLWASVIALHFVKSATPALLMFVVIVYLMALAQLIAIPLGVFGPNAQVIAILALVLLIWRSAMVVVPMIAAVAAAFGLLCLLVLVLVPSALYILFLQIPAPA
jgi:hypothetical protein